MTLSVATLAEELLRARDDGAELTAPSQRGLLSLETAYLVGRRVHVALVARSYRMAGRKIGFTNRAIWPELGIDEPIWAPVYDRTLTLADDLRGEHSLAGAVHPRIELEVVVRLRDVPPPGAAEAVVAEHVEWVALGFELVQCPFPSWEFTSADAVAAFGLHRALLVGQRVPNGARPGALAEVLRGLEVELFRNGDPAARGRGEDVLGGPLSAVRWLLEHLAHQRDAPPLEAGEVVTTGTLTGAIPVEPGEVWSARTTDSSLPPFEIELQS